MAGQMPYLRLVSPGKQSVAEEGEKRAVVGVTDQGRDTDVVARGVRLIFVSSVILVLAGVLDMFLGSLRAMRPMEGALKEVSESRTQAPDDRVVDHLPLIDKHFCRGLAIAQFCIELPRDKQ